MPLPPPSYWLGITIKKIIFCRLGNTILHTYAMQGNASLTEWALAEYPALNKITNVNGEQAIHVAALYGHIEVLKILLQFDDTSVAESTNKG